MDRFSPHTGSASERIDTIDALERLLAQEAELIADKALSGYFQMTRRRSIGDMMADRDFARGFAAMRERAYAAILADLMLVAESKLRYFAGHWRPRLAEALAELFATMMDAAPAEAPVAALRARLHDAQKGPPAPPAEIAAAAAAAILDDLPDAPRVEDRVAFLSTLRFHFLSRAEPLGLRLDGDRLVPALVLSAAQARAGA